MGERLRLRDLEGCIKIRLWPDQQWSLEEFKRHWCDEYTFDEQGRRVLVRAALMSQADKDEYNQVLVDKWGRKVTEVHNLITNSGISTILTALSQSPGSSQNFSQIFSCGNGAITGVARTDTSVAGEGGLTNNRKAPTGYNITGSQTDIAYVYSSGDANGPWSNVGLYGGGSATTSDGTGTLMTHAMFSYNKPPNTITIDYILSVSN